MILLASEKTAYKLIYVIILSILIHSFFSIVFPAGDSSGQQLVLGRIRLVYDNTVSHGLTGWPDQSIKVAIYQLFMGANLQAALSVIIARMTSIDIFYVHLSFIPVLWGVFTPVAAFHVTKAIGGSEKASALSSILISAFPYTTYFGAISVPNSLGFIFFYYSLYFMLRYLSSDESKNAYWMLIFSLFSFLSHYLTGIMSLSLLILATAVKTYQGGKKSDLTSLRVLLIVSFMISASLLPLSFIYLRVIDTQTTPIFTLSKLSELSPQEILGVSLLGELAYSSNPGIIFLNIVGPLLAFLFMLYVVLHIRKKLDGRLRTHVFFLLAAFLIVLIDYVILKLLMKGLPINEERLWVFRDLIAVSFVGLFVYAGASSLEGFLRLRRTTLGSDNVEKTKSHKLSTFGLLLALNVLVSTLLGGWLTFSLSAAYPQTAPLQTTWYELEAARYIDETTLERYAVIGDLWTAYAGESIVGINNPRAYYWSGTDRIGHDLFANMTADPSSKWMHLAMNYTNTEVAYFIVSEPRLGTEKFDSVVARTQRALLIFYTTGEGKLWVFSYKET